MPAILEGTLTEEAHGSNCGTLRSLRAEPPQPCCRVLCSQRMLRFRSIGLLRVFNVINQTGTVRFLDGQSGSAANLTDYTGFQLMRTGK
jgi:hypothetical protein